MQPHYENMKSSMQPHYEKMKSSMQPHYENMKSSMGFSPLSKNKTDINAIEHAQKQGKFRLPGNFPTTLSTQTVESFTLVQPRLTWQPAKESLPPKP